MSEKTLKDLEELLKMEQELDIPMKDRFHKTLSDEQISELSCTKGSYPSEEKVSLKENKINLMDKIEQLKRKHSIFP